LCELALNAGQKNAEFEYLHALQAG